MISIRFFHKSLSNKIFITSLPILIIDFLLGDIFESYNINLKILVAFFLSFGFLSKFDFKFKQIDILFIILIIISCQNLIFFNYDKMKSILFLLSILLTYIYSKLIINTSTKLYIQKAFLYISVLGAIILTTNYDIFIKSLMNSSRSAIRESGVSIFGFSLLFHILYIIISFKKNTIIEFIFFLIALFSSVINQSRGPLIALFFIIIITKWSHIKKYLFFLIPLFVLLTITIFQYRTNSEESTNNRIELIKDSISLIKGNPFGEGVGIFLKNYNYPYPHNIIIHYLTELGILFLSTFLIIIIYILIETFNKKYLTQKLPIILFIYFFIWFNFSGDPVLGSRFLFPLLGLQIAINKYYEKNLLYN